MIVSRSPMKRLSVATMRAWALFCLASRHLPGRPLLDWRQEDERGQIPSGFSRTGVFAMSIQNYWTDVSARAYSPPQWINVRDSDSVETERQLNSEADEAEDSGNSARRLRSLARNERERRDTLLDEWCAEYKTVRACEALLKKKVGEETPYSLRPAIPDFDASKVEAVFCQNHKFQLAHQLVTETRFMPEALLDQPAGVEAWRDNVLLTILRRDDLEGLMYRLEENVSRQILDDIGDRLVTAINNPDELQSLIDGKMRLRDIPGLHDIPQLLSGKEARPT
jgi:hypothetical protein